MKKIIAANWKMNHSFDEADLWLDGFFKSYGQEYEKLSNVEMILCPPAILLDYIDSELTEDGMQYLEGIMKRDNKKFEDFSPEELNAIIIENSPLKLGAQDCHAEESGSYTGNLSAAMLKKVGCQYVIVGHSERRVAHYETSELVAKKAKAVLKQQITPIICVGETKEIRDAKTHLEFVYKQLMASIPQDEKFEKLIIAYEPIWAIGTGVVCGLAEIAEMTKLIKKVFAEKFSALAKEYYVLYGGSVNSQNSAEILAINGVDGLLIGKASLDAEEFIKIASSSN